MKIAKLTLGETYVVADIFFTRGVEVEVTDELAKELAEFKVTEFDTDLRTFRHTPYFEIKDAVKATKAKAAPEAA